MNTDEGAGVSWDSAVIFAGGKSSRMGRDKALLPFGRFTTLSEYQSHRLSKWFDKVYISSKSDKFPFEINAIDDIYPDSSPMVALASSLGSIESDEVFIISVDMPYVDKQLIDKLYQRFREDQRIEIVIASSAHGLEPLCGIYSKCILQRVKTLVSDGRHRMTEILDICRTEYVACDRDEVFANMNTPEEYQKYYRNSYAEH